MGWVAITITFLMDKCHQTQIIVVVKILLLHKNIILGLRVSFSVIQPHISRQTLTNHSSKCDKKYKTGSNTLKYSRVQVQYTTGINNLFLMSDMKLVNICRAQLEHKAFIGFIQ